MPTFPFFQHLNKPGTPISDSLLNTFGSRKVSSNLLYIQSTFNFPLTVSYKQNHFRQINLYLRPGLFPFVELKMNAQSKPNCKYLVSKQPYEDCQFFFWYALNHTLIKFIRILVYRGNFISGK